MRLGVHPNAVCLQCVIKHVATAIPYLNEYIADPVSYRDRVALACGELNHAEMELGTDYPLLRKEVRTVRLALEEGIPRNAPPYTLQEVLQHLLQVEDEENTPPEERNN